ncbi:amidase [Roseomonas elaeocarpi]|uniref:Amidase n=1 Tax=Roseomonas elaeocarpi TaxID=907779 RepID=A0ABV6JPP8_9PROT
MTYRSIEDAAAALQRGETTALALTDAALARIDDPAGEGARAFVAVQHEAARAAARSMDALRQAGRAPSRWAGIPISIKDLYDQAGVTSRAGSVALDGAPAATATATSVARLERQGFVVLGRTNMVEFAFSGLGVNPHYGTPRSPWGRDGGDPAAGHLPGGSSSGAAVAVADGMGFAGLGSDTGGSCRVPAAMCGIVGWKPTAERVTLAGTVPLSHTLDSLGPLARTVRCCAIVDAAMAGAEVVEAPDALPLGGARFAVPRESFLFDGMEPAVLAAFERAVARLREAGATVEEIDFPELAEIPGANARGGFAAAEAWAWHQPLLERAGDRYDPRIRARIEGGGRMSAADYLNLQGARAAIAARAERRTAGFDAFLAPTCPLTPPTIASVEAVEDYNRINLLLLRNTATGNFLDRCSVSLPCHAPGEAPVGLMLTGAHGTDRHLLAVAQSVEAVLAA